MKTFFIVLLIGYMVCTPIIVKYFSLEIQKMYSKTDPLLTLLLIYSPINVLMLGALIMYYFPNWFTTTWDKTIDTYFLVKILKTSSKSTRRKAIENTFKLNYLSPTFFRNSVWFSFLFQLFGGKKTYLLCDK